MKTLHVIESEQELIAAACRVRAAGDDTPCLPQDATLILEDDLQSVRLQADGFVLSSDLKAEDIYTALIEAAGMKAHVT